MRHGTCTAATDHARQEYVSNVKKLRKSRTLKLDDPLAQLVTIPSFYAAFFGTDNKDIYMELSQAVIDAAPSYVMPATDPVSSHTGSTTLRRTSSTSNPSHKARICHARHWCDGGAGEKIRVGFSSMFFREHASSKMIVVRAMSDRERWRQCGGRDRLRICRATSST